MKKLSLPIASLFLVIVLFFYSCSKSGNPGEPYTPPTDTTTTPPDPPVGDTIGHSISLWGLSQSGGASGRGSMYIINADGTGYKRIMSFNTTTGESPMGELCKAPNGKLYGIANGQSGIGGGSIFSYDPVINTFKKIIDLTTPEVIYTQASFTLAPDGLLYFSASVNNGANGYYIFSFNTATEELKKEKQVSDISIANYSKFLVAKDKKLYALSTSGGPNYKGSIYSYDPPTKTLTKLYDFNGTDGEGPQSCMFEASDGNFYGTTSEGGIQNRGVMFRFNPATKAYTKLVDFNGNNGQSIKSIFVQSGNKLYNTSQTGGGSNSTGLLFSYDIVASQFKVEHYFTDDMLTQYPSGGLLLASNGKIYGAAQAIGLDSERRPGLYRFDPATGTYKDIGIFTTSFADGASSPSGYNKLMQY